MSKKVVIGFCVFVLLVVAPTVQADTIIITSGSLSVSATTVASYTLNGLPLSGQNFSVSASGGDSGLALSTACAPMSGLCRSGQFINLSSLFFATSLGMGTATLNGTTFNNVNFFGAFALNATSVMLPTGTSDLSLTVPFSFGGTIRGCADDANLCQIELFAFEDLKGLGLATLELTFRGILPDGSSSYEFKSLTYNFETPEIPEPLSLVLLGSGVLGLGVNIRLRRKRR